MGLVKGRKILSFIFTVFFVAGMLMLFGTFIADNTICRSAYTSKFILSSSVKAELDGNYERRITALSKQCGIPADVFLTSKEDFSEDDNVSNRFFRGYETTIYSKEKVETVKNYCKEYLSATDISYTEAEVDSIAEMAVRIYDESYGLRHTQEAYEYVEWIHSVSNKIYSSALIFIFLSMIGMAVLYSKKVEFQKALMSQFNATGFTFVAVSLSCLITRIGTHANVTPSVYSAALANAVRADFILLLIIGLVFTALSVYFTPKVFSKVSK